MKNDTNKDNDLTDLNNSKDGLNDLNDNFKNDFNNLNNYKKIIKKLSKNINKLENIIINEKILYNNNFITEYPSDFISDMIGDDINLYKDILLIEKIIISIIIKPNNDNKYSYIWISSTGNIYSLYHIIDKKNDENVKIIVNDIILSNKDINKIILKLIIKLEPFYIENNKFIKTKLNINSNDINNIINNIINC